MNDTEYTPKPNLEIQVSEKIGELVGALAEAQKSFETVEKNREGQAFGGKDKTYKYADWSEILKMVLPKLGANGLVLVQNTYPCLEDGNLYLQSAIYHTSGQFMRSYYPVCSLKSTRQQEFGSNLTYAKRYGGSALLGISTEEDTDAQGSEAKTEGNNRKTVSKAAPAQPGHDHETGEVAKTETEKAEDLYAEICSDKLTERNVVDYRTRVTNAGYTESQKKVLRAAISAREIMINAQILEHLNVARENIAIVGKTQKLSTEILDNLLKAKEAELTAMALPTT